MQCPYCKKQMIEGSIWLSPGIGGHNFVGNDELKTKVSLGDSYWNPKLNQVYYCKDCKYILKKLNN